VVCPQSSLKPPFPLRDVVAHTLVLKHTATVRRHAQLTACGSVQGKDSISFLGQKMLSRRKTHETSPLLALPLTKVLDHCRIAGTNHLI